MTADGKVEARALEAERTIADRWVVTEGLRAGDRVIVEGVQKVRPGAPVRIAEASTETPVTPVKTASAGGH